MHSLYQCNLTLKITLHRNTKRALTENDLLQHSPDVSARSCKIWGVGWVRKVFSKEDKVVLSKDEGGASSCP